MISVKERFLEYVKINTQSEYSSKSVPSTKRQLDFAKLLAEDCKRLGFTSVELSEYGYVYCYLKGNAVGKSVGFIAHMDTSPDFSGENVKPVMIEKYDGNDITLANGAVVAVAKFPALRSLAGQSIITTDGTTLLGADNKAGIAEILTAVEQIIHNGFAHPDIYVAITPDEEVGRGMDNFDMKKFMPRYAYTIDGGIEGELEYECFNAARALVSVKGEAVHTGSAKGVMKNAVLIASEFVNLLPENETPALTEGREGFFHVNDMRATVESANFSILIRDFDSTNFQLRKDNVLQIAETINRKHGKVLQMEIKDEYSNMREVIEKDMSVVELAERAYRNAGVKPVIKPIRGGTDGGRLSFMGIPCPNIFTGGHNFHGPFELISIDGMNKAVQVIIGIVELCREG